MKENQPFLCFGRHPDFESLLAQTVQFNDDDWENYKGRKNTGGVASAYSDTIPLIYSPNDKSKELVYHDHFETFANHIDLVVEIATMVLGVVAPHQAMLTRLRAGTEIGRHKDKGELTSKTHRIHIPIITNESCIFTVEEERRHLRAGEIWMIDNVDRFHSVVNSGQENRIHLIIDVK
jgi:hypothetical protein